MIRNLEEISESIRQHPRLVVTEDFEICVQEKHTQQDSFIEGKKQSQEKHEQTWIGLRILHRKQAGRAYTTGTTKEAISELVEMAFTSSQLATPDPWFRFPIWKRIELPAPIEREALQYQSLYDPSFPACEGRDGNLNFPGKLIEKYSVVTGQTFLARKTERTPRKFSFEERELSLSIDSRHEQGVFLTETKRLTTPGFAGHDKWLKRLQAMTLDFVGTPSFEGRRKSNLLLSSSVVSRLLEIYGEYFCADKIIRGDSPFFQSLGKGEAAACLSVSESPSNAKLSLPFDLEGVLTQDTQVLKNGQVVGFLHDSHTSGRENRTSTGSLHRTNNDNYPRIQPLGMFVHPGEANLKQLVERMGRGLYCPAIESIRPVEGERGIFDLVLHGFEMTPSGEGNPLRHIKLRTHMKDLFRAAAVVGNDLVFWSRHGSPSILFENIPLGL